MRAPVVDFGITGSSPDARRILETLRDALGRVSSLVSLTLLAEPGGHAIPAGGTTLVAGTRRLLSTEDAFLSEARLVVDGSTAAAGPITVEAYDVTAGRVLATAALTTTAGLRTAGWVAVPLFHDHTVQLRVLGDGVNTQTIHAAELQLRTRSFRH